MIEWTKEEDDEFDRIQHEIDMKSGQPYIFDKAQRLTDKELLMAYGWKDSEAETILQHHREMVLEGLRNIEKEVLKKNKLTS
jgi:hypothetical protein